MAPLSQISIDHFDGNFLIHISYVFIALLILVSFLPWKKISSGSKTIQEKQKMEECWWCFIKRSNSNKNILGFFFIFVLQNSIFGISLHVVAYLVFVGLVRLKRFFIGIAGILNFVEWF